MKKGRREGGVGFLMAATCVVAAIFISRLFYIQIVEGAEYREQADDQYVRQIHELFDRGDILFSVRGGDPFKAAMTTNSYIAFISPQLLKSPAQAFEEISGIIDIDRAQFFEYANDKEDPYAAIKKNLEKETADKIDALNIIGVGTHSVNERYYPGETLAAHTIGFLAENDKGELGGRYGVERSYDDVLGSDGGGLSVNAFADIFLNLGSSKKSEEENADVLLTVEKSVQIFLERQLEAYDEKFNPEKVGGIVMDPHTGEIKAMAALPSFNVNDFGDANPEHFRNPNVSDVFEMGSIIKVLTMAAGLDTGAITENSTYYDAGSIMIDGYRISNVFGIAHGTTTMQGILSGSLNVGASWIASRVGYERFGKKMLSFGLGEKSGIDLPSEATGLVGNLTGPSDVGYATASFGQGIALTPVATIRALSIIPSGGLLVTPHVGKAIRHEDGSVEKLTYPEPERVIKESVAKTVADMLIVLVDDILAGGEYALSTHSVGIKTGTAQMADPETGTYSQTDFLHSYYGFFPAHDPEFVILLWATKPKGREFASQTFSDPFFELTNFLIDYYGIEPDRSSL